MTITRNIASLILACSLAFTGSTGIAATQQEIAEAAKLVRTPADVAKMQEFNRGFTSMMAQQSAQVKAAAAKMSAYDKEEVYADASLVSAAGIAKSRAAIAAMTALALEDEESLRSRKQQADRYIAQTPLPDGVRSLIKDRFDKTMVVRLRDAERNAAAQKAFLALLGGRLDFAEARLGKISLGDNGNLVFANAKDKGPFSKIQNALVQAQARMQQSVEASTKVK